jgi:chitin-binding protein
MQMKQPGTGTSPIVVQSLRRVSGVQTIKRKVFTGDVPVGRTDLGPLHDKWTDVDLRMKIGNGTPGTVRRILKSGGATGSTRPGRAYRHLPRRPCPPRVGHPPLARGHFRSLQNCHMLLTRMRAHQFV